MVNEDTLTSRVKSATRQPRSRPNTHQSHSKRTGRQDAEAYLEKQRSELLDNGQFLISGIKMLNLCQNFGETYCLYIRDGCPEICAQSEDLCYRNGH